MAHLNVSKLAELLIAQLICKEQMGRQVGEGEDTLCVCECVFVLKNDYEAFSVSFFYLCTNKQICCQYANSTSLSLCKLPRSADGNHLQLYCYKSLTSTLRYLD